MMDNEELEQVRAVRRALPFAATMAYRPLSLEGPFYDLDIEVAMIMNLADDTSTAFADWVREFLITGTQ